MEKRPRLLALLAVLILFGSLFMAQISSQARPPKSSKIRRTILLTFKPEASKDQIDKIFAEIRSNLSQLKGVHNVFTGAQVNERATFKHGISMDFDDEAALKAYRADQEHRQTHNKYNHLIEAAQISDLRDE
jgi:multidrug efflux pump subunit AcrB